MKTNIFFRLGKIDRGDKGGDKAVDSPEKSDVVSGGNSASSGAEADAHKSTANPSSTQDVGKDKSEKKKKPKQDFDNGAPSTAGGAGVGVAPARAQAGLSVNDFISKTKNQTRQGLKPSGPELIAYARYLGIDPVADHDLLWIAYEALEAPLPSDWTEHFDSNDRVFYYNATMRVSSWTHPLEHIYRETYKTIVNFRNANMAPQERGEKLHQLHLEVKQMEHDVHKEISQWSDHMDEQGNRFYFNKEERQSTWTDPRPAKCQILHLRMKMLSLLQSSSGATPGFSSSKMSSAFAPLSGSDFDDPSRGSAQGALKRPKVGGNGRTGEGGLWSSSQAESGATAAGETAGRSVPSSPDSARGSDSESEDDRKGKKKKKKKKKKKRDQAQAEPPPRAGGAQNLRNSQSEPTVGAKPLLSNDVDGHAKGGIGGLQPSPSGPNTLSSLANLEHTDGLSNMGRTRVKAGIRLEPIGQPSSPNTSTSAGDGPAPKGVRNSASVPALQP
mmetsp:Transcript_24247/g.68087  ORF Transcript_24247/g.68087 Transcript_24247/m.68087 type:complete len:500 (-) Transcript_24247:39-1538(-)